MSVKLECESCGHRHKMGDRIFDPDAKRMTCPKCGAYPFTVDRGDLTWHPSKDE
jgi:Zn finger protein HypA/HybF involved in hydrogenase expression